MQGGLSTTEGIDKLYGAAKGRPVDILMANAGRSLGRAFLDQDFERKVIDTNITGTLYLIHKVGKDMRRRNSGRILITGSIAAFAAGSFSGGVQRQQGVSRFLLRIARGATGVPSSPSHA